jgi:hypothetical protein
LQAVASRLPLCPSLSPLSSVPQSLPRKFPFCLLSHVAASRLNSRWSSPSSASHAGVVDNVSSKSRIRRIVSRPELLDNATYALNGVKHLVGGCARSTST